MPAVKMEKCYNSQHQIISDCTICHQLINHGVSSSLVDKLKLEMQKFFNLTIEEKKRFAQEPGDVEGYGQAFVVSEEQKLDWANMFYMVTLPTHLRKPHLLPNLPLPFRYKKICTHIHIIVFRMHLIKLKFEN